MERDHDGVIAALTALLAAEAEAIRRGALPELGALAARMAELMAALPAAPGSVPAHELMRIRVAAEANSRLLAAALRGVEAARARMTSIRRAGLRLDTYDSAGRARAVSFAPGSVERRA